jgi:pentapeptide MXKDX repeat protein
MKTQTAFKLSARIAVKPRDELPFGDNNPPALPIPAATFLPVAECAVRSPSAFLGQPALIDHLDGMGWDGMGWDGMGWNGMEWNGMEWDGMEWNGMERDGID